MQAPPGLTSKKQNQASGGWKARAEPEVASPATIREAQSESSPLALEYSWPYRVHFQYAFVHSRYVQRRSAGLILRSHAQHRKFVGVS